MGQWRADFSLPSTLKVAIWKYLQHKNGTLKDHTEGPTPTPYTFHNLQTIFKGDPFVFIARNVQYIRRVSYIKLSNVT